MRWGQTWFQTPETVNEETPRPRRLLRYDRLFDGDGGDGHDHKIEIRL